MAEATPAPVPESKPWKPPYKTLGLLGLFVGLILTLIGVVFSGESNDRSAGRIGPQFEMVSLEPTIRSVECIKRMRRVEQFGRSDLVFFADVGDFCNFNPRLLIRNTGDESIETLRIEVEEIKIFALVPGLPAEQTPMLTPHTEPSKKEVYELSEHLRPGAYASIPLYRPMLRSIVLAQEAKDQEDVARLSKGKPLAFHGEFEIRCYAKAFGTTRYDQCMNEVGTTSFVWTPSGFDDASNNRYLELEPTVRIGKSAKVAEPRFKAASP